MSSSDLLFLQSNINLCSRLCLVSCLHRVQESTRHLSWQVQKSKHIEANTFCYYANVLLPDWDIGNLWTWAKGLHKRRNVVLHKKCQFQEHEIVCTAGSITCRYSIDLKPLPGSGGPGRWWILTMHLLELKYIVNDIQASNVAPLCNLYDNQIHLSFNIPCMVLSDQMCPQNGESLGKKFSW